LAAAARLPQEEVQFAHRDGAQLAVIYAVCAG
jgi:hypothetical protein